MPADKPLAELLTPAPTVADLDDRELVAEMEARGWTIHKDQIQERHIEVDAPVEGRIRFGMASDTHLGSKYQQLTHLRSFCKAAEEWGVDFMLHGGDVIDGIHKAHRGMEYEQFKLGSEGQSAYAVEHLPEVRKRGKGKPVPWHVIGGNHDGWAYQDTGTNILTRIALERPDFHVLGAPQADFHIGPLTIRLLHPSGGTAYARSYKLQKIVEQISSDDKPHILVMGHWHIAAHVPGYRNVEAFAVPCFQSQTPYLQTKGLAPVIGGLLWEAEYDANGLRDLTSRWCLFRRPVEKDWP